ncbi:MAG TPA: isochorismatase family protein [Caulobacteraceae bacterium]|jgi:nicotinamidase-related amidase|nr:isochorismatase family protein [Caulobacteraceae bacterium]
MKPFLSSIPYAAAPMLVCLDLQRQHTTGAADIDRGAAGRCVETCKRVLRHARAAGWQIAHVQRHDGRMAALPELFRPIEGLEPRPREPVFYRDRPSAFASTAFRDYVGRLGDPRLIVIGFSLHASVLFTAVSGFEAGTPITVVEGALAAPSMSRFSGEVLETVLLDVLSTFAEVVSTDELLDSTGSMLLQAANHP